MKNNFEEQVTDIYMSLLRRKPDKAGLYYFVSQLKAEKLTIDQVKNIISESEECKMIKNFTHYTDKYWNDLEIVEKYKNKLATGNENTHWISDILVRFKEYLPFDNVLIVGCGNGWLERELFDLGIGLNFDAFDISEKYIQEAEEKKGKRSIRYFIDDVNNLQNLEPKKYDAIFNFAILHHATEIENSMKKLSITLKSEGLIFNEEYVGPARNQYSDAHFQIMLEVMSELPDKFRSKHTLRPPLTNFRVEPSEAIHSDMVIPMFKKYFDTVYEKNLNGGIAYQILWNNIENFQNKDPEAKQWLEYLLTNDFELTKNGKIPTLFWYCVGKPKIIEQR